MNEYITTLPELLEILKEHDLVDFSGTIKHLESLIKLQEQPNVVTMLIDEDGQDPENYIRVMGFNIWYEDKIGIGHLEEYICHEIIWTERNPNLLNAKTWKNHYEKEYTN